MTTPNNICACVRRVALLTLLVLVGAAPALAAPTPENALHILDYIGVDYPATVANGKVVNATEYNEQLEFAERLQQVIAALPQRPGRAELLGQAQQLSTSIRQRHDGGEISAATRAMRDRIVTLYGVTVAPRQPPNPEQVAPLYQTHCASCHGEHGRGDGPAAASLTPRPINFHDTGRAYQRSVYGLYSAITQGVDGTAMTAFSGLSAQQRWALAFYVGNFAFSDAQRQAGARLWAKAHTAPPYTLAQLTQTTPSQAREQSGADGLALLAYLRSQPQATVKTSPLSIAVEKLDQSLASYRAGDRNKAYEQALSAYLDGFELAEASLRAVAPGMVTAIEQGMLAYRKHIRDGAPLAHVAQAHEHLRELLSQAAQQQQDTKLTPTVAFVSALVILLREGLEAILILAAVGGVLVKTGRRDALPYLHAGWVGALLLGFATWGVSSYIIGISGAGREVTEGVTALIATVVLLYVGFWLHNKTHAVRWQQFVKERIQTALHGRALWLLTLISFVAVYREVFETVLFYQALWLQSEAAATLWLWGGIASGALALLLLTWIIIRSSIRLPLQLFFKINSAVMLLLAVAFAGHGMAGLQEAGVLPADPVNFPRIGLLGIYPTAQTLAVQALLIVLVAAVYLYGRRADAALSRH